MKNLVLGIWLLFCVAGAKNIMAQPQFDDEVQDSPIDSYSAVLLSSGLFLGMQKLRKKSSEEQKAKKIR